MQVEAREASDGAQGLTLALAGRWLTASALTLALVGLAVGQVVLMAWGLCLVVWLLFAFALGRSLLHDIERGELRLEPLEGVNQVRLAVGRAAEIPLQLVGTASARVVAPGLVLKLTGGARGQISASGDGWLASVEGLRVGYGWLQGCVLEAPVASGLVRLRCWLPLGLMVSVLPRRFPLSRGVELTSTRPSERERAGLVHARRRGFGLELRELREHMPGDSYRHIAWAASARRGRLITREFESDAMVSAWLMVDVSPSMFWGQAGSARIDFALEAAFALASSLSARGDRIGVLLYDERVRVALPPRSGKGQATRVLEVLMEAYHLIHEDRTDTTERELLEAVARWLEVQRRRSFHLPWASALHMSSGGFLVDDRGLYEAVVEELERCRQARPGQRFVIPESDYARAERHASYRAFCRHVGIPLPLEPTSRVGGQGRGFEAATHFVLRQKGGPHTMIVFSDFSAVEDLGYLRRSAMSARRARHSMIVFSPADPAFVVEAQAPDEGELGQALEEVAALRSRQALADVDAALRPAGVRLIACSPGEVPAKVMQHLDRVA